MRLGIDLDGVVANFTAGWMRFYNAAHGTNLEVEDSRDWHDLVKLTHFEDIDQFWDWSSDLEGRSIFWHLDPFPGAVEALKDLHEDGHEIVIITTKPRFAVDDTHDWIRRQEIPTNEVHITERKWMVDCDAYLDDGPYVLPSLVRHRPDRIICRYARPWNKRIPGTITVHDFDEFRDVVAGLT